MRYFILLIALLSPGCFSSAQESMGGLVQKKPERALFKRSNVSLQMPAKYESRELKNGKYNPRPRIVTVDEKAAKYELRWIGYDGKEKVIHYQMRDALDALVEASTKRSDSGFLYYYRIKNLTGSPTHVGSFIVQTFSSDIRDEYVRSEEPDLYMGQMSNTIPRFSDGVWRTFAPVEENNLLVPGTERVFHISSQAGPGIVGCSASAGHVAIKGVGEEMPSQLSDALPSFEGFASCITIGPDERLAKFSKEEKVKYLLENLSKFVEAGWMAGDTPKIYESILRSGNLVGAFEQAKTDLEKEFITSEVFHIIEGLSR